MRTPLRVALIALSLSVSPFPFLPAYAETPALSQPLGFADLVEKLSPAVVNISTTQKVKGGGGVQFFGLPLDKMPDDPQLAPFKDFFDQFGGQGQGDGGAEREVTSLGSGFIIDAEGYIITNNHVIDEADDITATLPDNTKLKAKVIGKDKKTDLALLKVDAKKPLPFVPLGDSDKMRVGDWVLAIGNPYGLGGSVTQGIISARQRSINAGPFDDFLQTDAPINRGNSGGPLFNISGEVIGINSAIFSPSGGSVGIGFAIPTNLAKSVIDQLKKFGRTHRAWLGVKIQEVSDEVAESVGLAKPMGALVVEVSKTSPADKAKVEVGDIITHFDGKELAEMRFLPRMVAETPIGKTVDLTVWRKGKSITIKSTLEELDEKDGETTDANKDKVKSKSGPGGETVLGLELTPLTKDLRDRYSIDTKLEGLMVLEVKPGSEAAKRGVQEGAIILEVSGEAVKTVADFRKAVETTKKAGRKFALLKVAHEKDTGFITLPVTEEKEKEKP